MAEKFDAIIIGTGQSGPSLAARMTREGMKTAIIERKLFGGTCVNVGCIPTKALVASARAAYMARRGADFGVAIDGSIAVDMKQVKARKDGIVRQSNEGVTNWLKNMNNLTVYEGHGRLQSATSVRVNGDLLEAERIVLNVGGRAFVPDMPGVADVDYLTNSRLSRARPPHSSRLVQTGDLEWVRTYEVDDEIHHVVKAGQNDPKYASDEAAA